MNESHRLYPVLLLTSLIVFSLVFAVSARTVEDSLGREVTIDGPAESIVATIVSTTEIALDLNLENKLVGITSLTKYLSYVPELQEKAEDIEGVGGFTISIEKIAALDPDLILIDGAAQKDLVEKLTNIGATVYASGAESVEDVKEEILEIGYLAGKLGRAQAIVGEMEYKELMLEAAVSGLERRKRIFYAISKQMYTAGGNTFVGRGLELAGLNNVFSKVNGFKPVSNEEIVNRDPELIIATEDMGLDESTLRDRPGFESITAVKEGNILLLPRSADSMINQPGTKIIDGIINLFELVYERDVEL